MKIFIIYTVIMMIILFSVILTLGYRKEEFKKLDKRVHTFKRLYGLTSYAFDLINKIHYFNLSSTKEKLGKIDIEKGNYYKAYIYVVSKLTISFVAFLCIASIGYIKCINDTFNKEHSVKVLYRSDYGDGDKEYRLNVVTENKNEYVKVNIPEKKYTKQEIIEIFDKSYNSIIEKLLGNNTSVDNITENLNFISNYKDIIDIYWNVEENNYIDYTGNIQWSNIDKNAKTNVEMILSTGNVSKSYIITLNISREKKLNDNNITDEIEDYINTYSEYDKEVVLPDTLGDKPVKFFNKRDEGTLMHFMMALMVGIILYIAKSKELQKKLKKRNEELETDYVFIISKIAILHSSGMTILSAWDKIIEDYNRNMNGKGTRYAYEEMKITRQKIKNGASEVMAYVEFGRRCGLHSYIKLGNLLEQNVRKGTKGLKEMLNQEVDEAYANRKVRARKKGDEAGTKLLLPMVIMLIISMIIVIVPAFMSINV